MHFGQWPVMPGPPFSEPPPWRVQAAEAAARAAAAEEPAAERTPAEAAEATQAAEAEQTQEAADDHEAGEATGSKGGDDGESSSGSATTQPRLQPQSRHPSDSRGR